MIEIIAMFDGYNFFLNLDKHAKHLNLDFIHFLKKEIVSEETRWTRIKCPRGD